MIANLLTKYTGINNESATMSSVLLYTIPATIFYSKFIPNESTRLKSLIAFFASSIIFLTHFPPFVYLHLVFSVLYTFYFSTIKTGPWKVFLLNFVHLLYVQWGAKQYFTGSLMMAVVKNTMFAWDCSEERHPYHSIKDKSFLDYIGYMFFPPTFFVGPPFSFRQYKLRQSKPVVGKRAWKRCFAWVFITGAIYLILIDIKYENILSPLFGKMLWEHKIIYLQLCGIVSRCKYYMAWKLAEGSAVASGMGFDNVKKDFSALRNSDIYKTETATSMKTYLATWNALTASWLKNYVYCHLKTSRAKATIATFVISAIWHGIHPGYYLTFVSGAFFTLAERKLSKFFKKFPSLRTPNSYRTWVYNILSWFVTWSTINYVAAPFMVYEFWTGIAIWREFYFIYHILALFVIIIL